jgi:Domain of unknown function (DUF4288)
MIEVPADIRSVCGGGGIRVHSHPHHGVIERWRRLLASVPGVLVLITARSAEEAMRKALHHGESQQTSYKNVAGETITWMLRCVVDVAPLRYPELGDGVDLCARHFRNLAAYEQFDPLLSGGLSGT